LQDGPEPDARSFCIRKELLDNATTLFRGTTEPRIIFRTKVVKTDPVVFDMFINWLNHSEDPVPYLPCHYSQEPWRSRAVDVWLFAKRICAPSLERYALSQVVRNCAMQDSSAFACIEREAKAKSALRRFSNHWVAWNCYLAPEGQSEYVDLAAAKLASVVNSETNDPRIFEIEHWYSPCGDDINSSCIHDPVVRENAVNELFASRRPRPEWGLKWEAENKASREKQNPVPSTLKAKNSSAAIKLNPPPPLPPRKTQPILSSKLK